MKMLRWVPTPLQQRSERTLEALLDATERLIEKDNIHAISVAVIAREAGSSVGAFYHRFPDKVALTRTVYERFRRQSVDTIEENFGPARWHGEPLEAVLSALVAFTVHEYLARPGLRRFVLQLIESDPAMRVAARSLSEQTVAAFGDLLERRVAEHEHPDCHLAAEIVHRMLFSTLDQVALFHGESPTSRVLTEQQLSDELTSAILAYVGVQPAAD